MWRFVSRRRLFGCVGIGDAFWGVGCAGGKSGCGDEAIENKCEVAIAGTPGAAWALAAFWGETPVVVREEECVTDSASTLDPTPALPWIQGEGERVLREVSCIW